MYAVKIADGRSGATVGRVNENGVTNDAHGFG
jgi:hypothetical protein